MVSSHERSRLTLRLTVFVLIALAGIGLEPGSANAVGTFSDDDGNPHEAMIEANAQAGVTKGCAPNLYCPGLPVTRAQAATFIARAFGLGWESLADPFSDDNKSPHEADINALHAAGITKGCGPETYCPNHFLTRGEAATLLGRALGLSPPSSSDRFWDDDNSVHEPMIEAIAAIKVTNGCTERAFCPKRLVTRDEMASLVGRAIGLSPAELSHATYPAPTPGLPESVDIANAVRINPGSAVNSIVDAHPSGTVFLFGRGVHFVSALDPKSDQKFVGEDGAILTGDNRAMFAFIGNADRIVLQNLIVERYANPAQLGAIIPQGRDWVVRDSEFRYNAGAGVSAGPGHRVINNHIHHNAQIGLKASGPGVVVEGNEISYNNYQDAFDMAWEAGGTKFVDTVDLIVRNNFVHHNHGAGLWTDINNIGTLYEGNVVTDNYGPGIFHEISYRAVIRDNIVRRNAFKFYVGGILIASSSDVEVHDNIVEANNGGIAAIDYPPDSGTYGPWEVSRLYVHHNIVSFDQGWSGLWSNSGPAAFGPARENRFLTNSYVTSGATPFRWDNASLTYAGFVAAGQS